VNNGLARGPGINAIDKLTKAKRKTKGVAMSIHSERRRRKLFLVQNRRGPQVAAMIRCAEANDFPAELAKIEQPVVDTAGKDAPLSSQEGI
jgi:hypothetical protein